MIPYSVHILPNLFTKEEVQQLFAEIDLIDSSDIQEELGRVCYPKLKVPHNIFKKIVKIVRDLTGLSLASYDEALMVIYSSKYGKPVLPPHFDGDNTSIVLDYQLSSNTSWPLGLDLNYYPMNDNDAIAFDPNKEIHWRPHKEFYDEEYMQMIFFRFTNIDSIEKKLDVFYEQDDLLFKSVKDYRDSLVQPPMRGNCALHFPPNPSN